MLYVPDWHTGSLRSILLFFFLFSISFFFVYRASLNTQIRKERNVLFNDALNTFYLWLYRIRHMLKDHSDSERGNLIPPHGLLFPISSKGFFYMHHPTYMIAHTTGLCYTSRGTLARTRNSSMGPPWRIDPTTHHAMSERSYHGATSRS